VIDCTGFKGMIINQTLKEPFIDYGKYLANNKAIAVQIKHPDPNRIDSLTKSTALGAGWVWRVPLFNRIGTGYVFSGNHRTDDEAMDEFKAHLGDQLGDAEPRIIPMRVGRTERAWVKNCIAVGLSGGFIEPLESTAIHMIDMSVRWLAINFPTKDFEPALVDRYNNLSDGLYNEVLDFICIHYRLGNRTDSQYWIDTREELEIPDRLAANLEVWKHRLPQKFDLETATLFDVHTYNAVLLGKRVYETGWGSKDFEVGVNLDETIYRAYLAQADKDINNIVARMPDHKALLKELRGEMAQSSNVNLPPLTRFGAMGVPGMPPSAAPAPKHAPVEVANDDLNLL
jgi:tryptophan halogenase